MTTFHLQSFKILCTAYSDGVRVTGMNISWEAATPQWLKKNTRIEEDQCV